MILPDVNILVHAFRADSPEHLTNRAWLDGVVNGDALYGMACIGLTVMLMDILSSFFRDDG